MITLEDVLIAKENRVARRELFQLNQALPVLTFSLNIPGNVKDSDPIRKLFRAGVERIEKEFLIEKSQIQQSLVQKSVQLQKLSF